MSNWNWQKVLFTSAAIAIVAGVTFTISSSFRDDPVLDRPPQVIREIDPREFEEQGEDAPTQGGIVVVPSELFVENAVAGVDLPAINVTNRSPIRQTVDIDFVPVSRATEQGVPVVGSSPADTEAGRDLVRVTPERATLGPGESVAIRSSIVSKPENDTLVGAIGVSAAAEETLRPPEKRGVRIAIDNVYRINAMVYASFGDSGSDAVELRYLRAEQQEDDIRLLAGVESVGSRVATPQGSLSVLDESGQQVFSSRLAGDQRVIPGERQELVPLNPIEGLEPGIYEAEVRVIQSGQGQSLRRQIEIAPDGRLSDIGADLALTAERINSRPGQNYPLQLQLLNTGNKGYSAKGSVEIYDALGSDPLLRREIDFGDLQPDGIATEEVVLPAPREKGSYAVVATVRDSQGELLVERSISMGVTSRGDAPLPLSIRFRDWLSEDILRAVALGVITFGVITALLGGLGILVSRRREKKSP